MIVLDRLNDAAPHQERPEPIDRRPRKTWVVLADNLLRELGAPTELRNAALARLERLDVFLALVELRLLDFPAIRQPRRGVLRHLRHEHRLKRHIALRLLGKDGGLGGLVGVDVAAVEKGKDAVVMILL